MSESTRSINGEFFGILLFMVMHNFTPKSAWYSFLPHLVHLGAKTPGLLYALKILCAQYQKKWSGKLSMHLSALLYFFNFPFVGSHNEVSLLCQFGGADDTTCHLLGFHIELNLILWHNFSSGLLFSSHDTACNICLACQMLDSYPASDFLMFCFKEREWSKMNY